MGSLLYYFGGKFFLLNTLQIIFIPIRKRGVLFFLSIVYKNFSFIFFNSSSKPKDARTAIQKLNITIILEAAAGESSEKGLNVVAVKKAVRKARAAKKSGKGKVG